MNIKKNVFIIDKNNNELNKMLNHLGYNVINYCNLKNILNEIKKYNPDLILFDFMMFGNASVTIIKEIRSISCVPIIIITNNDEKINKIMALELGADDYILKPFDLDELSARIKAINRRYIRNTNELKEDVIKINDIEFNLHEYKIKYNNKKIYMPPKEYELFYYLVTRINKVVTREKLLKEVWNEDIKSNSRTLDVHITRLREKLKDLNDLEIVTIWGKGYKFIISH
ncbi:MAG: response regulator transcription factor [Clostridium sp.]|nr:response regulator transcription factor [Clostridium sp.]